MHRSIRLLALFNFFTDFSFLSPVAVIYFARVSGSFALGMSVFSLIMLSSAILEVPTGIFSDRIGRKYTIMWGAAMDIGAALCIAVGASFGWLAAGAILAGAGRAFYSGNNDAYLHDVLVDNHLEHEYETFLGQTGSMFQVALAISALFGGFIAAVSFAIVAWLDVLPALAKFAISYLLPESRRRAQSANIYRDLLAAIQLFLQNKQLRILSIASMFDFAIGESQYQFRAVFVNTLWPVWALGISKVLSNVGAAISYYFSGKIIKRYGAYFPIVVGDFYSKMINFFSLLVPTIFSPVLMTTTSLFYGVSEVGTNALLQKEFTEHQRATMASLNSLGGSLLFAIFSLALGILADKISSLTSLVIFQFLSLIPLCLFLYLFQRNRKEFTRF